MALVAIIFVLGVVGYVSIERWSPFDALYMTVITLTTVGFMEVHPLSPAGRVFTMVLIINGVASFLFLATSFVEYVVGGSLTGFLRTRRMQQTIGGLSGHYIVCGYGRVGEQVVKDLRLQGKRVVVVEASEPRVAAVGLHHPMVVGDATDEGVLARAGIGRADGLVAATGEDTANIVVTLTARAMNPRLIIVARADSDASEPKLRRAGATHVISPYRIAGRRIATQLLHPSVSDFLDLVMHTGALELWMKEVAVDAGSALVGQSLEESRLRDDVGINVLAIAGPTEGEMITSPPDSYQLRPGDRLIVLGTNDQLARLARMAASR